VPEFVLQFPVEHVSDFASRYEYATDEEVLAIGKAARERGYYLFDEFVNVCRWKTTRSSTYVARNRQDEVETATRVALSDGSSERQRIKALRSLHGVEWPTASVLLHLAYPERYPGILDQRTLQALGIFPPPGYSFSFWDAYRRACIQLAEEADVDGRTFDRGLWQSSKEHGQRLM
jgi:hypothetical protein